MAIQTGTYITTLNWETADSDAPTRARYQQNWSGTDSHNHDGRGAGQGIRTIQTTNAPAATGDIELTGDNLEWWGASAAAIRTAVSVEGIQTISAAKTFSAATALNGGLTTSGGGVGKSFTNTLGANVLLSNTAQFFDGPSVAQGATGTWLVTGYVTINNADSAIDTFDIKLHDGTNTYASTRITILAGHQLVVPLSAVAAGPAGNLRLSVKDNTSTSANIIANGSGLGFDSTITAVRVA